MVPYGINVKKERGNSLGEKSIAQWGSFIFIVNQIYGPGVLSIPKVFQQSGWFLTILSLTFFLIMSCLASTLLCEALTLIPGNKKYEKHIEYSVAIKYFFGKKLYFVFQILNNLCIQAYNIASIAICAQSLDQFFVFCFKKSFALVVHPYFKFISTPDVDMLYNTNLLCISLGYIIICAVSIPTGFMNLNDNVSFVQTLSFLFLFVLIGEFIVQYFLNGIELSRVPAFGHSYYQIVSIFVFSWAYPMFIPSWVNEKKDSVSVNKAVWSSGIFSWFGYLFIGWLGACAYGNLGSDNILNLMGGANYPAVTRVASYLFSLGVIMPGIPVCFITIRYNLYVGYICGKKSSYFWGVIAPWFIAFVFCNQKIFADLLTWSSLILNTIINFLIPFALYLKATQPLKQGLFGGSVISNLNAEESQVQPFPKRIAKYHRLITLIILIITIIVCIVQVVYDAYKSALGYDPLD
ncbi:hypothetical protein DICPUDRAFT_31960 [Dictyostelium purpureum]|uniref:Amino acid transporter transmembrane domain-containing protein n=1 Tax=Dictyostelium purpureum TaxID=5786 RepID=F0ZI82_DICPU|nr:uncharacterized protein DICPUDRAFT_31960 [Dictyostelium purpureum]EGC36373.1 hypothetical protein DICPUDRAFT_31960 [Dictyostelium purpureum]|eukprot:XP_003287127.1 hypothetical protein DICPUDRAFT_31960 [Dictyostelium purpureum]